MLYEVERGPIGSHGNGVLTQLHRSCWIQGPDRGGTSEIGERAERRRRDIPAVEQLRGRNGQLSLRHQSLHGLSDERLEALTVMHNYFIQRRDGTTAAERFFGRKPEDLFAQLMKNLPLPARPAQRRVAAQTSSAVH